MLCKIVCGEAYCLVRAHRAICYDGQGELVVIYLVAYARVDNLVFDALNGRKNRVDRYSAYGHVGTLVLVLRDVAAALLDAYLDVEMCVFRKRGNVLLRRRYLDVGIEYQVAGSHFARTVRIEYYGARLVRVHLEAKLLYVENYLGNILFYTLYRRKLMKHAVDLYRCCGSAGER